MGWFEVFTLWLSAYSICFTFLPVLVVLDWKRRGSADGYSSINYVLPMLTMCCWYRHGLMTNDNVNIYLNLINLAVFSFYTVAFAYYQPIRKYLFGQVLGLVFTIYSIVQYVDGHSAKEQYDVMASIAAATQIISLFGGVNDILRAISLKTTEYIPATIQFGVFALTLQWTFYGVYVQNYYIAAANVAGLAVNVVTLALYFVYPPKTWVVPLFNVGGEAKAKKKQ
ncbi:unnamed protein product [Bursaphelenchus okinawaensis]|uniref:Sugar transporter SWEET n=1 Tax=Bursaphelenchus okinawaensis TaxID=465554 RepID=A0A811LB27_9BILA|nr:unnamed protein product [Bursaphelenchus okinawaensis]CAG9120845.1 unnamed protein product [Bursaphelenchus okinawaensis]